MPINNIDEELKIAVYDGDLIKKLLCNSIDEELGVAAYEGDLKKVTALLSAGANPNFQPNCLNLLSRHYGSCLLHYVRSAEVVKKLLLHGAWVNFRNIYNETPLHTAIVCGRPTNLVKELLKHGADVNAKNRNGNTPLNLAVKDSNRNLEVIRQLLEYGAFINIRNRERRLYDNHNTPLDNAMRYPECAKLLVKFTLIRNFNRDYKKMVNLTPYKTFNAYSELLSYCEDCVCEIRQMKTDSIDDNLSLYELVTVREVNKKVLYADAHKRIRNKMFQVVTSSSYPIYHDVISGKIGASLERESLLNKLSELEVYTKFDASNLKQGVQEKTFVLDWYSKYEVAQYLSNKDLLNFVAAYHKYTDQPSCLKKTFTKSSIHPNTRLYKTSAKKAKRARLE